MVQYATKILLWEHRKKFKVFFDQFQLYAWKGHSSQTLCWDFDLKTRVSALPKTSG